MDVGPLETVGAVAERGKQRNHGDVYDWCQAGDHRAHRNLMRWTEDGIYACRNHVPVLVRCKPALWIDPWSEQIARQSTPTPINWGRVAALTLSLLWLGLMMTCCAALIT